MEFESNEVLYLRPETLQPLLDDYFDQKGKGLWSRAWDLNSESSNKAARAWLTSVILEVFNG